MQRDSRAYLNDIVEACGGYRAGACRPESCSMQRREAGWLWIIAQHDAPVLHFECSALLKDLGDPEEPIGLLDPAPSTSRSRHLPVAGCESDAARVAGDIQQAGRVRIEIGHSEVDRPIVTGAGCY